MLSSPRLQNRAMRPTVLAGLNLRETLDGFATPSAQPGTPEVRSSVGQTG
jgi:hypothetical protein